MPLPPDGELGLSNVRTELGASGALSMGSTAARELAGRTSGLISLSHFYGKSAFTPPPFTFVTGSHKERYQFPMTAVGIIQYRRYRGTNKNGDPYSQLTESINFGANTGPASGPDSGFLVRSNGIQIPKLAFVDHDGTVHYYWQVMPSIIMSRNVDTHSPEIGATTIYHKSHDYDATPFNSHDNYPQYSNSYSLLGNVYNKDPSTFNFTIKVSGVTYDFDGEAFVGGAEGQSDYRYLLSIPVRSTNNNAARNAMFDRMKALVNPPSSPTEGAYYYSGYRTIEIDFKER